MRFWEEEGICLLSQASVGTTHAMRNPQGDPSFPEGVSERADIWAYVYSWMLGDGTGTGSDPSQVYNIPGLVRVVCSVTDGSGSSVGSVGYVTVG